MATSTITNRYKTINGTLTTTANGNRAIDLYLPNRIISAICVAPNSVASIIPYLGDNGQWVLHFIDITTQGALANTEVTYEVTYI